MCIASDTQHQKALHARRMDNFAFLKLAIPESLLGCLDLPRVGNETLNSNSQPFTLLTEESRMSE